MPTASPKRLGIGLAALLVVTAAAVSGIVWFASGKAGEVDLTTAEFVPADAAVYVAVNTDLASPSWLSAFDLVERLGRADPEGDLKRTAGDADLDWEEDVVPFLGGNAAFYMRGIDPGAFDAQGGVIIRCQDCAKAIMVLRREAGDSFEHREYRGYDYLAGDGLFISGARDHIFVAPQEESLLEMLDLAAGDGQSLAASADFKRLRDELSPRFLGFVYVAAENLAGPLVIDDPVVRRAMEQAGVGNIALKPLAFAFGAKADGFEAQAAAVGDPGTSAPLLTPHAPRFAAMVPAETQVFFDTTGIADAWGAAIEAGGPRIDEAVREITGYNTLDDALRDAGRELGLESLSDLIEGLTGEAALAVWDDPSGGADVAAAFLAEVSNPTEMLSLLRAAAEAGGGPVTSQIVGGIEVFKAGEGSESVWFAARDGDVLLGNEAGIKGVLELEDGGLAAKPAYLDTVGGLSAPTGTFAYIDLPALLSRVPGGGLVEGIGSAVINIVLVPEQGLARLLAFISVPE